MAIQVGRDLTPAEIIEVYQRRLDLASLMFKIIYTQGQSELTEIMEQLGFERKELND